MPLVDLDRFDFLYSERVKGMKTAATRDLMATLSRPGIISLAGGFPDTRAFGEEAFREISRRAPRPGRRTSSSPPAPSRGSISSPRSSSTRGTPSCARVRPTLAH